MRLPEGRIDVDPARPGRRAGRRADCRSPSCERGSVSGPGPIVLAVSALLAHKNVGGLVEALPAIRAARAGRGARRARATRRRSATSSRAGAGARCRRRGRSFPAGWPQPTSRGSTPPPPASSSRRSERASGSPCWRRCGAGSRLPARTRRRVPEVAGDAALMFDPHAYQRDRGSGGSAAARSRRSPPSSRERGRRRAAEFTWRRTAEETLASFERARRRGVNALLLRAVRRLASAPALPPPHPHRAAAPAELRAARLARARARALRPERAPPRPDDRRPTGCADRASRSRSATTRAT